MLQGAPFHRNLEANLLTKAQDLGSFSCLLCPNFQPRGHSRPLVSLCDTAHPSIMVPSRLAQRLRSAETAVTQDTVESATPA